MKIGKKILPEIPCISGSNSKMTLFCEPKTQKIGGKIGAAKYTSAQTARERLRAIVELGICGVCVGPAVAAAAVAKTIFVDRLSGFIAGPRETGESAKKQIPKTKTTRFWKIDWAEQSSEKIQTFLNVKQNTVL